MVNFLKHETWRRIGFVVLSCLSASLALNAQTSGRQNDGSTMQPVYTQRGPTPDLSDLAKENDSRVAASSVNIRAVLVREAGLLVELKRWVAKEATDNGQIVEDSELTDQAIFERLDRDVNFRSLATRLLQRYGYLMPNPNPESDLAKEQDLVLKERARRLVAIEGQEDAASLQPKKDALQELDRATDNDCDPRRDDGCESSDRRRPKPRRTTPREYPPQDLMRTPPSDFSSTPMPSPSPSRTMQAQAGGFGLGSGGED